MPRNSSRRERFSQARVRVRTLKVGEDPAELPVEGKETRYVVPDGYRGVQATPVTNGTYYLNPYVETITPVEVRSHGAKLTDIEFPSRTASSSSRTSWSSTRFGGQGGRGAGSPDRRRPAP